VSDETDAWTADLHPGPEDDKLRAAVLDSIARLWGFEDWRAYCAEDLRLRARYPESSGLGWNSRAEHELVRAILRGVHPHVRDLRAEVATLRAHLGLALDADAVVE
jgi:hypothetical protein